MKGTVAAAWLFSFAAPVLSETTLGLVIFTRHGDRTAKMFEGYRMTSLGSEQLYASGSSLRDRYVVEGASHKILGIASDIVEPSEIWASTADQAILLQTATNLLQGLYPSLVNEPDRVTPLEGNQYIPIHGKSENDPDTIWVKGDEQCPAYSTASKAYMKSSDYLDTLASSRGFYSQFAPALEGIVPPEDLTFARAFDVFDLLNVAAIHNEPIAAGLTPGQLAQLRFYADQAEWGRNYNLTQPERSIGGQALAGAIVRQLKETVSSQGRLKLSLFAGSYDTFLAFFGLTDLTAASADFRGLPVYASTMTFEIFSKEDVTEFPRASADLHVRFLFRNGSGTTTTQTAFPLFGQAEASLPYDLFVAELESRAIRSVSEWCATCQATVGFCSGGASASADDDSTISGAISNPQIGLSTVEAGIVGAMVTLGVLIFAAGLFALARRLKHKRSRSQIPLEKRASGSDAESCVSSQRLDG